MNWTKLNDGEYVSGEWRIKLREEDTAILSPEPDYDWLWVVYQPGDDYNGEGYDAFFALENAMECAEGLAGSDSKNNQKGKGTS
jgi:hypothetical protein